MKGGLTLLSEVIDPVDQDEVELLSAVGAERIGLVPRRSTWGPPGTPLPNFKGRWTQKGMAPWESDPRGRTCMKPRGRQLRPAWVLSEGEENLELRVEEGHDEAQPQP